MKLLVDIGNTRIKWGMDNNGLIQTKQAIEYKQSKFIDQIKQAWFFLDTPQVLAISSVSKVEIVESLIALAKVIWPQINVVIARSSAAGFSIINAYKDPDKLGVDRWLGLIALKHFYPGNSCIIDCGTAITVDVLNENGQHLGGLISPGLTLMKASLFKGTEDLSYVDREYAVGLADCTEAAIYSGALYTASGLIEKSIAELCDCQTIILTGGDAKLLSRYVNFKYIIEPEFVLKGLSLYSDG